ncbi:DoxX family protein [Primorskyibacter sedentarius]|uniref:Putative oxidoreductase n=1 Tax=Primorskyibacter sedentarius TaxID=745311 RepID=A0A4R3J711_9RHOB|nr:DoxX family protein [Primorskyibacter sedentarius]TCS61154.1 putative oxidoreductase [Primorskyibacter sedentarius]
MFQSLSNHAPKMLAVLRIMAALLFIQHGTQKLLGFPAAEFSPAAFSLFWWGGLLEIVGGGLILIGLFTRASAFLSSGMMAVAYFMFHAPNNFFPANNGGDASILFCFVFLLFVFTGPGAWSVDAAQSRENGQTNL